MHPSACVHRCAIEQPFVAGAWWACSHWLSRPYGWGAVSRVRQKRPTVSGFHEWVGTSVGSRYVTHSPTLPLPANTEVFADISAMTTRLNVCPLTAAPTRLLAVLLQYMQSW